MHLENLPFNYEEAVAVLLFVIGFCMLLFSRNLIKKVIGLDIMDSGVFLLLADRGYIAGRTAPIIVDGVTDMSRYVNPIPAGLVLTGIVVSVSVSAVMLSLTVRIWASVNPVGSVASTSRWTEILVEGLARRWARISSLICLKSIARRSGLSDRCP